MGKKKKALKKAKKLSSTKTLAAKKASPFFKAL